MFSMFRRPARPTAVTFCESCGRVCAADCRGEARLQQVKTRQAMHAAFVR